MEKDSYDTWNELNFFEEGKIKNFNSMEESILQKEYSMFDNEHAHAEIDSINLQNISMSINRNENIIEVL